ncbi:hypothetical protein BDM02DRAFT_1798284 [Thelephora ganbajun]|uniref:Uncharacterized protein n=1 Tax=Thelephora ganbajun TaxID=370292 RepID=A0ACB6Z0A2_THEGA|nr:hypothetical protein BDM02DRAFT_1798284 [Thelephora ganbajun]
MTRAQCSHCQKEADKSELKRCSRCQYLLYCSKECQILSWKTTHKYNRQRRSALHNDDDTQSAREGKIFTSWLNTWTVSLCSTAAAALDLANHESDYLLNHCLCIQLKKTGHKTDARRFTIDEIGVSHVDPLRKEYPELSSMLADPPQLIGKRVRFLVVVKDQRGEMERARARVWTDDNIETYRNMSKEHSQAIAAGYMIKLVRAVEAGDIEAMPRMMNVQGP